MSSANLYCPKVALERNEQLSLEGEVSKELLESIQKPATPPPIPKPEDVTLNPENMFELFTYHDYQSRRRVHTDPLSYKTIFEQYHSFLERREKRAQQMEREWHATEKERMAVLRDTLEGPTWKSVLPKYTVISNVLDSNEMELKRAKTIKELDMFLRTFEDFKESEKALKERLKNEEEPGVDDLSDMEAYIDDLESHKLKYEYVFDIPRKSS